MPVIYQYECECGGQAVARSLDLTQEEGQPFVFDIQSVEQIELKCQKCGKKYYTGDLDVLSEDEL